LPIRVFKKAKLIAVKSSEPLRNHCINKCPDMVSEVLGQIASMVAELLNEGIQGVLPIKELPQVDARGVQAKPRPVSGLKRTAQSSNSSRSMT
jgi:hypothetical protein